MKTNQKHHNNNDSNQTRIALLEQSIGHIDQTLMRIESTIEKMDKSLNARIDKVENRLWQILFLISSSIVGIIIAKIFHWI
jgi:hypothetical protein